MEYEGIVRLLKLRVIEKVEDLNRQNHVTKTVRANGGGLDHCCDDFLTSIRSCLVQQSNPRSYHPSDKLI